MLLFFTCLAYLAVAAIAGLLVGYFLGRGKRQSVYREGYLEGLEEGYRDAIRDGWRELDTLGNRQEGT